jgi:UDP-N-acetylmuramyl pentapeptide phosphotransferase/UDP-N-acetylglucosamine-1-phosphate transferase
MKKFAGQVAACLLMVLKGGMVIKNLHGLFGIGELPWVVSVIGTILFLIVVINSFNLIDGVDGLAGALGVVASFLPGMYFLLMGEHGYALLAFCLTGSVTAFMSYNFQPARIFMGDTGSLLIGLICSVVMIHFLNMAPSVSGFPLPSAPAVGFSLVMIPVLDAFRVSALRLGKGVSPFIGDRNHIHHLLLDKGFSHKSVTFTLVAATLVFTGLAYLGKGLGNTVLILGLTVCYFLSIKLLSLIPASSDRPISTRKNEKGRVQLKPVPKITLQKKVMAD